MMYFEAIFQPNNLTHYNSDDVQKIVGKKIAVQDGWILEKGPHKGQQGYYLPNSTVGLIPASDLKSESFPTHSGRTSSTEPSRNPFNPESARSQTPVYMAEYQTRPGS